MATVADVAKRAGVSVSTAARVLSGTGYAAEETRRLVLDAARELGYVPNQIARSLRTRQTQDDRTPGRRRRELLLFGDREARGGRGEGCRLPRRPVQQRRRPEGRARVPEAARRDAGRRPDRHADLEEPAASGRR